jgi:hypothetical protein
MLEELEERMDKEWKEVQKGDWQKRLDILSRGFIEYTEVHHGQKKHRGPIERHGNRIVAGVKRSGDQAGAGEDTIEESEWQS